MSEKVNVHVTSNFSIRFIAPQGVSHSSQIKINLRESPAGPVVRTRHFHLGFDPRLGGKNLFWGRISLAVQWLRTSIARGMGLTPGWGTKIPQSGAQCDQNINLTKLI